MHKPLAIGSLLLVTSALVSPAALAQSSGSAPASQPAASPPASSATSAAPATADNTEENVDVSVPGASNAEEIVVTGRNIPNSIRATPQVISVLSAADIARTGEGDVAGALTRVTGLTVVGNGFVYVRGLGDRYSLALLNGSPLPSPEPLRRVVPLDIFPTSILASTLVQKSYSVNYPGEFGGGVINLTTKAIPTESYLTVGGSVGGDSETTGKLGYTYYGSDTDWLGYDDGARKLPTALRSALATSSTTPLVQGANFTARQLQDFAASLTNTATSLLQRNNNIPVNLSADVSGGTSFDVGDKRLGVIASAGYSNTWRTRDVQQQESLDPDLAGTPQRDFQTVITDNRVTVNGLLGFGAEFGEHKVRWTNLYIHDTLKQGRLSAGADRSVADQIVGQPASLIRQNTYFFERQLFDTQFVGEFKFNDLSVDLRGTYANSKRESPYERGFSYTYDPLVTDYVNNLTSGGQSADIAFSDLEENIYAGGIDLAYKLPNAPGVTLSGGYNYSNTERSSERFQFQFFRPDGALNNGVAQQRPDYLLSDFNIYSYNIQLRDVSGAEGSRAYDAKLRTHAGYAQIEAQVSDPLRIQAGVRYEDGNESVVPDSGDLTRIKRDYWLPAATITWNFAEDMQLRLAGSKTVARPQFRELARQLYQDFESDRQFTGNPFLTDSQLYNGEARYEYYFDRGQRVSIAGFYKKIDKPIEAVAFFAGGGILRTGFANAPEAQLYGGEFEIEKHFPLDTVFSSPFFSTRRLVAIGNYTYSKSKLKVDNSLVFGPDLQEVAADALFRDGAPLTGQSDHVANIQLGIEDTEKLSQFTVLLNYASNRVTNRGPIQGTARQPDIEEKPGFRLDLVGRQAITLAGTEVELKIEARNLTGTGYKEFQKAGANVIYINRYDVGRSLSLGLSAKF